MALNPEEFGKMIARHRGGQGIRAAAKEIGTSHSTLSRIENGQVPDVELFEKICAWMKVDPAELLDSGQKSPEAAKISVHLRKKATTSQATAKALAELIIKAEEAMRARDDI